MYIIGSKKGDRLNAQIANTVFQITSEPPTIAVSINKNNLTHQFISETKVFSVSVLYQDTPLSFVGQFGFKSGRDINKLEGVNYKRGESGTPVILDNTVAFMEAKVVKEVDVGTHTIFIGEVTAGDVFSDKPYLTYEYYQKVKRGVTPKTAPSYIEPKKEIAAKMAKYQCQVCGYIYDPDKGDSDTGIKPGTPFEGLPEGWICPVCSAAKDQFVKIDA
jgi:flavin reductase (DIM6/NTAB) family NADH-FMN oxidoreductase RutF/rubredoxin